MLNLNALMNFNQTKQRFMDNHPSVQPFLDDINSRDPEPGQEVAIAVRYPDGTEYKTGIRITEDDMQMLSMLRELIG